MFCKNKLFDIIDMYLHRIFINIQISMLKSKKNVNKSSVKI